MQADLTVKLYAGATLLASKTFADYSLEYVTAAGSQDAGQLLAVEFVKGPTSGGLRELDIDNVRVTITS
ncbi:hypothetical protein DFJ74DRAFT_712177 [Hyaloraphidium curvatum]|nr:hypothetical protein DFJ74DRAFT_712177 [Hyaloraphidium curvatum]